MKKNTKIYALYQGEELICDGTVSEIAETMGLTVRHICRLKTPKYIEGLKNRKYDWVIPYELILIEDE